MHKPFLCLLAQLHSILPEPRSWGLFHLIVWLLTYMLYVQVFQLLNSEIMLPNNMVLYIYLMHHLFPRHLEFIFCWFFFIRWAASPWVALGCFAMGISTIFFWGLHDFNPGCRRFVRQCDYYCIVFVFLESFCFNFSWDVEIRVWQVPVVTLRVVPLSGKKWYYGCTI